jgi:chromosomal replication initiator protein
VAAVADASAPVRPSPVPTRLGRFFPRRAGSPRKPPEAPPGHWYIRRRPGRSQGPSAILAAPPPKESLTPGLTPQLARDWASIRTQLREAVPDSTFELWLAPLQARAIVGDTLVVAAPDEIRSWVADRYGRVLQTCAAAVLGPQTAVDVVAPHACVDDRPVAPASTGGAVTDDEAELHPKFAFDQFVIGDSNRFAHAAALAVAELPGQDYNPLFLYGAPGLGKTHLLHAIGNYVRAHGGGLRVRSTTAERFTNAFVAALQCKGTEDFKARFRDTDVLLIDDVQFLQRKARTEEEFFHTFNALYETGSQLVLTCDRLPADMAALEERLLERFQAGLVAELAPPDLATRMAILRKRVHHDGIVLADEAALHAIALRITSNARALEGALIRVVAFHSLTGRPIDAALADEVLAKLYPAPRAAARVEAPTIDRVQEVTCAAFGVSRDELLSSARSARVAWARQVAMYLARRHTDATLPAIGQRFGGRNHTTVMYACRKASERLAADSTAQALVQDIERRLAAPFDDRRS